VTLRTRLIVAVALIVLVVGVTGAVVLATQREFLIEQVDTQLRAAAQPATRVPLGPGNPAQAPAGQGTEPGILSDLWVGTVSADGTISRRVAPGLGSGAEPNINPAEALAAATGDRAFTVAAVDGSVDFRVLATTAPNGSVVVIGSPLSRVQEASNRLLTAMAVGGGVIVAGVALLGWWVWRLGLRPIKQMTVAADAITAGDLDRRIDTYPPTTEAGHLALALNTMLDARQAAENKLRRFVGDASHELRTPLTSIRGYADLYRRGGLDDPAALDDAMRRINQESVRMAELVDDLLLLARLDQGRPLHLAPVDVAAVLRDAAADAAVVDPDRNVELDVTEPLVATADEPSLRQVVGALVTNALVHTPSTAAVTVRGAAVPGAGVVIEVADRGPGMAPDAAAHAFERFYRGDPSRSRHHGGSGLGLSIVESIVAAHGGRVELETAPGAGATLRVLLPAGGESAH